MYVSLLSDARRSVDQSVDGLSLRVLRIDDDCVDRERLAGASRPSVREESRSWAPATPTPVHGQLSDRRCGNRGARQASGFSGGDAVRSTLAAPRAWSPGRLPGRRRMPSPSCAGRPGMPAGGCIDQGARSRGGPRPAATPRRRLDRESHAPAVFEIKRPCAANALRSTAFGSGGPTRASKTGSNPVR